MKKIMYFLLFTSVLYSCKTNCLKNYKDFSNNISYSYLGFESSSFWVLENHKDSIQVEVTKNSKNFKPSKSCHQVNFQNGLEFEFSTGERFTLHQNTAYNKEYNFPLENIAQSFNGDTIVAGVVHYNPALTQDSIKNDIDLYFIADQNSKKDILVYNFKSNAQKYIRKIFMSPEEGVDSIQMNYGTTYSLKENHALLAPYEDFIEEK